MKKLLEENKIILYSTYGNSHSAVVERFNRTLKSEMFRRFSETQKYEWLYMLDDLLKWYNNKVHSSIKMTPQEAHKKENEEKLMMRQAEKEVEKEEGKKLFKVGNRVRISKMKGRFEKGYLPNWSTEIFTVIDVLKTNPVTYKLADYKGEVLEGSFYNEELQQTEMKDIFLVQKILKERKRGRTKEYFVKYLGYNDSFNEWLKEKDVLDLKDV